MAKVPAGQRVSLIGYSYGTRVIANALHIRALGGLSDFPLPPPTDTVRVVMTAAAMSNCSLHPGRRYGCALSQIDKLLVIYNPKDPVLKRYGLVEKGARPQALGYTGLCRPLPGDKERQINASGIIGKSHYEPRYLYNPYLRGEMRSYLLWR